MQQYKLIQTLLDPVTNFGKVTVSTGYSNIDIVIVLDAGHGDRLPNPSFNLVWWNSTDYLDPSDDPYVEIVRVTDLDGDVLTIERPQEGTAQTDKNLPGKTYKMILSLTAKMIPDLQTDAQERVDAHQAGDVHVLGQIPVIHDDISHQGSAKRDTASGVAGLDAFGNVLAPGSDIQLIRDGSDNIRIVERGSGVWSIIITRMGTNDYDAFVLESGAAKQIQTESMKNVPNGIAGLDANAKIIENGNPLIPTGIILAYGGTTAPTGYLLCDGSAVSRTTYVTLYSIIGTTYGIGDGSTTFNVPDFRSRSVLGAGQGAGLTLRNRGDTGGAETHILTTTEMPAHTHNTPAYSSSGGSTGRIPLHIGSSEATTLASDSQGGNGAHNNMMPFGVANYIIKT